MWRCSGFRLMRARGSGRRRPSTSSGASDEKREERLDFAFLHGRLGWALVFFAAIAGVWGVAGYARRRSVSPDYWGVIVVGHLAAPRPGGHRALQIMESSEFDRRIADLKMSGMSGMDLIARVKERAPHLSIVILSGYGDMDDGIKAMRVGITDYLKKPFSIDEVLDVVKREVKKSQARAAAVTPAAPSASAEARPEARPARVYIFSRPDLDKIEVSLSKLRGRTAAEP